jgi:hypothetical protein
LQTLVDQVAREIDVGRVSEHGGDLREAVARKRTRFGQAGQAGQSGLKREGNLPLHLFRPKRGSYRVDLDLPVGDIRHRINRQAHQFTHAKAGEQQHKQQHEPTPAHGSVNDTVQHQ